MNFTNAATAGSATIKQRQRMSFFNTATAGSATITNGQRLRVFPRQRHGQQRQHHQLRDLLRHRHGR